MTVMDKPSVGSQVAQWSRTVGQFYCKDLSCINDEQYTKSFAGVARPANEFTAEVVGMLQACAGLVSGNPLPEQSDEAKAALEAKVADRVAAQAAVTDACEKLAVAIENMPEDQYGEMVMAPWGMDSPKLAVANVAAGHVWYHDGQLNYIQSLHGDEKVHWMDE